MAITLASLTRLEAKEDYSFDRYQIIIDRKPFGTAPPPPKVEAPTIPPGESFANKIRMSALIEMEDGTVKIGLIDTTSNTAFYLAEGETDMGVELVAADYENETAILKKGEEVVELKLASGAFQALTPAEQQQRLSAPTAAAGGARMSYAERRAMREKARREAPPPKYTGEELEKHLQEYQMEVLRQGLPPLPIPLTEEMDDQLVREGVLPPVQ